MTEIKIPFTKIKVEKYAGSDKPANEEGLKVEVMPIFFENFYEEIPPNTVLTKINLGFLDGAEKEIYDNLLDDKKDKFELSFEKEKVLFHIVELGKKPPEDENKLLINYIPLTEASLKIIFKPKFAGVVKITCQGSNEEPNKDKGKDNGGNNGNGGGNKNNNDNDDTNKKITNLQNQINTLEEKLRKQPTSDSNSEDKEKLERLKAEIEALKRKQKDKPQNENEGTEKNNFPYGLVIGGGVVIFLLLIAVIFFWQRSKRK